MVGVVDVVEIARVKHVNTLKEASGSGQSDGRGTHYVKTSVAVDDVVGEVACSK